MTDERIAIRRCRQPDVPAVLDLWAGARSEHASTLDRVEDVERLIAESPAALLVAERGGEIIGALIAAWDGWRGNMYRLAVRDEHRRQGIGLALTRAGEDYLRVAETLDERGEVATANIRVALDFRDAAGTAVASAAVGLESYANFQLQRLVGPTDEVMLPDGKRLTLDGLRDLPLHDRYRSALPSLMGCQKPTSEERSLSQRLYGAEYRPSSGRVAVGAQGGAVSRIASAGAVLSEAIPFGVRYGLVSAGQIRYAPCDFGMR